MAIKQLLENPYERLGNAIVIQAARDYRVALKRLELNPRNMEAAEEVCRIERFFESSWYQTLTSVDGKYLIKQLRKGISE